MTRGQCKLEFLFFGVVSSKFKVPMRAFYIFLVVKALLEIALVSAFPADNLEDEKFTASLGTCHVEIDEPCSSGKVIFYLYTNASTDSPVETTAVDPRLSSYFNTSRATKVIIHGFVGHVESKDSVLLREVYLQENAYNLVVVDWGALVKLPCYPTAVFSTWQAGKCTAIFLESFIADGEFQRVHAVGFSLGAHVAGFVSNQLNRKLNKHLGRITGLDPALPFFASLEKDMKLEKGDADFVDVIHTNVGIFGKIEPTGHVDFYMNGGFIQPACHMHRNIPLCSHLMAIVYYAESVTDTSRGFRGIPCPSHFQYLIGWCNDYKEEDRVLMGEKCDKRSRGVYFVNTRSEPPFALG